VLVSLPIETSRLTAPCSALTGAVGARNSLPASRVPAAPLPAHHCIGRASDESATLGRLCPI
jgi:hypothetical protein